MTVVDKKPWFGSRSTTDRNSLLLAFNGNAECGDARMERYGVFKVEWSKLLSSDLS
ncbi:hypothetical protein [Enterobacter roggenkampii]|uniref:hypothetical protein n=1 Tax=Enterobacter roggenkampii TaxID=1812935 RepID=UPI00254E3EE4|nr:hypothetical protein [Enterobacter roggenkampii]MDL0015704.1 hypothetical protein [Enterobacter roggenkampii]